MARAAPILVLTLALAAIAMGIPPGAAACTGTRMVDEGSLVDAADMVFIGTVVKRDEPFTFGGAIIGSADPIGWTFVVESVEKGPQREGVRVESPRSDASCGIEFRLGQRYRVSAHDGWGTLTALQGDATQLEPLAAALRPPTEPGGVTFPVPPEIIGLVLLITLLAAGWWWLGGRADVRAAAR